LSVDWKREVMMDGESGDEGNDELVLSEMIVNRLAKISRD